MGGEKRFTIRADGPDGLVHSFYADTDLMELEVCPASELHDAKQRIEDLERSAYEAVCRLCDHAEDQQGKDEPELADQLWEIAHVLEGPGVTRKAAPPPPQKENDG